MGWKKTYPSRPKGIRPSKRKEHIRMEKSDKPKGKVPGSNKNVKCSHKWTLVKSKNRLL